MNCNRVVRILLVTVIALSIQSWAQLGGQLRFCLRSDPKTFNPNLVDDDASETVRYLTGGVLVRLNRKTQTLEPGLATKWEVSTDGRGIIFTIREHVLFSDGTPFTVDDVASTVKQLMDPSLHSPTGDAFRSGPGPVTVTRISDSKIAFRFPQAIAGMDKLFDQVAIMSSTSPLKEKAVLGPFQVSDYKSGSYLLLTRNPHYWKHDSNGRQLPYLESVRLDILQNRDLEVARFRRGDIDLINSIDSDYFDQLNQTRPGTVHDAGASLDSEEMWFNQVAKAPIPSYKKEWFSSANFRKAISSAINRQDMVRLVFNGHAEPAFSPVSPANKLWFNPKLSAHPFDQAAALKLLSADGFRLDSGTLRDHGGNLVEFSVITNSGNKSREKMVTMIQQDLAQIGIKVNLVTLDFPALIQRITQNFDYEACLLGLVNTDIDPNSQMNIWLSSSENHQWNPSQKTPATKWEQQVDDLMRAQASSLDPAKRKQLFDQVQEIVWENEPFIYLVHKNALSAFSSQIHGIDPVALRPQTYWQVETISSDAERVASK